MFPFALLCVVLTGQMVVAKAVAQPAAQIPSAMATEVNPVIEWNRTLLVILRTPGAQPPAIHSTRSFAMLHAAMFDAVNAIDRTYEPYTLHLRHVSRSASTWAAADQAAHDVLVALYPSFSSPLDAELQQDLDQIPDGRRKTDGIALGEAAATTIVALRQDDGSSQTLPPFVPKNQPGSYQLTPPNFAPADFTQLPRVAAFAIASADDFLPGPPPELTSDTYTASFKEVKSLGLVTSTTRTTEQTEIGKFWNGNIQDFWNEIAQAAALQHGLGLVRSAHLFAELNFALADTAIVFFHAKYTFEFWRPVTAIRAANTDGNPDTIADPNWTPLGAPADNGSGTNFTPPFPSYASGHATFGGALFRMMADFFGTDNIHFSFMSDEFNGITRDQNGVVRPVVTRSWDSFSQAAEENGQSRIYLGIHWSFDKVEGIEQGTDIADYIFRHFLRGRYDGGSSQHHDYHHDVRDFGVIAGRELAYVVSTTLAGPALTRVHLHRHQELEVRNDFRLDSDLTPVNLVVKVETSHLQPTADGNPSHDLDTVFQSPDLLHIFG